MYFLVLPRKAGVPLSDIVSFYCTCVRPLLEYCALVFHHALPSYLNEDFQRIQKPALNVISPQLLRYSCSLRPQKPTEQTYLKLFQSILIDERLNNLVPPRHKALYNLRHLHSFTLPRFRTDRFKRFFIPAMNKYINSKF